MSKVKKKTAFKFMNKYYRIQKTVFFLMIFQFFLTRLSAQEHMAGKTVICSSKKSHSIFPLGPSSETVHASRLSYFEVTYSGFPPEAVAAFDYALSIWERHITSTVPIRVHASWSALGMNQLASTRPTKLFRGFPGAIQADIWYPVALAEKITGKDLNDAAEPDIEVKLSQHQDWYFGTDGNTPEDSYDLVTIALHELAHGFGFVSSAQETEGKGSLRDENYLTIFDLLLENKQHQRLSSFPELSAALFAQFTSDQLYIYSPTAAEANGRQFPKLHAPGFFSPGSSLSHLDEAAFPKHEGNALMSSYFSFGQSIHEPGGVVLGILADLGWNYSKEKPYEVVVFPNPGTGVFNFQFPINLSTLNFTIIDVRGRKVSGLQNYNIDWPHKEVDLSHMPNGVYIAVISTPVGEIKKRMVLIR